MQKNKMEGLMRKQICDENTAPSSSVSTSMHKNSQTHTTSKVKAKIRIIHIFAPEIIKTDPANFREVVQRLTGNKPTAADHDHNCSRRVKVKREKLIMDHAQEEEEIWRDANTGGGFLGGFPELDHFPFMEGTTTMTNKDACVCEEPQLLAA